MVYNLSVFLYKEIVNVFVVNLLWYDSLNNVE